MQKNKSINNNKLIHDYKISINALVYWNKKSSTSWINYGHQRLNNVIIPTLLKFIKPTIILQ